MKQEFTAKTVEDALALASTTFGTDKHQLEYRVMPAPQAGLFSKFFNRTVTIEAWVHNKHEDLQAAARQAVKEALSGNAPEKPTQKNFVRKENALNFSDENVVKLLKDYIKEFGKAFDAHDLTVEIVSPEEAVVQTKNEFLEDLLSRTDRLSLAFEHIFKRIAQKKIGDVSARVRIEAGNAIEMRKDKLIDMAKKLSEKVLRSGKPVTLSSRSSQERKVIHLALEGMTGIGTKSVGAGENRKLIIFSTQHQNKRKSKPKHNGNPNERAQQAQGAATMSAGNNHAQNGAEANATGQTPAHNNRRRKRKNFHKRPNIAEAGRTPSVPVPVNTSEESSL